MQVLQSNVGDTKTKDGGLFVRLILLTPLHLTVRYINNLFEVTTLLHYRGKEPYHNVLKMNIK